MLRKLLGKLLGKLLLRMILLGKLLRLLLMLLLVAGLEWLQLVSLCDLISFAPIAAGKHPANPILQSNLRRYPLTNLRSQSLPQKRFRLVHGIARSYLRLGVMLWRFVAVILRSLVGRRGGIVWIRHAALRKKLSMIAKQNVRRFGVAMLGWC